MANHPILSFDTSGINRLADDPDSETLITEVTAGFHARLTFTSVSELVQNSNSDRRQLLLRTCNRMLTSSGDCIDPQHEIIRKMVERFEAGPSFDWRKVDVRFVEAENEIARLDYFTDELAAEEREEARTNNKVFLRVFDDAKPAFDRLFTSGTEKIPESARELVARLQIERGAFWTLAGNLYARVGKNPTDESLMRKFVAECDPFRSQMIAFIVVQYDRCVRPQNVGPSLRTGRNDTFMASCLPYCHYFVTDDATQLACYREVAAIADIGITLSSYEDFRERLQGQPTPTAAAHHGTS
jgi:hypothetical protein